MYSLLLTSLILCSLMPSLNAMCFEPEYRLKRFYVQHYRSAPYIAVGRVSDMNSNKTHQSFRLHVSCVYKAPPNQKELILDQVLSFITVHKEYCKPKVEDGTEYVILFDEVATRRRSGRKRRKKKKNRQKDFSRMATLKRRRHEIIETPIPVRELARSQTGFSQLVQHTRDHQPVGRCYNVWSPWTACSAKCSVGEMSRSFQRYEHTPLFQRAVCYNAPCDSVSANPHERTLQSQPVSVDNCKSLELVEVPWCNRRCDDPTMTHTAISWRLAPVLLLCSDSSGGGEDSLKYQNVAVPSECGCVPRDETSSHVQYAVIDSPEDPFRPSAAAGVGGAEGFRRSRGAAALERRQRKHSKT